MVKKKIILPVSADVPVELTKALPLPPTTTEEQDVVTAGQRRINFIWEMTQAIISVAITGAVIYCEVSSIDAPVLTNAFFLIVSMYYIRTNHTKTGGLGTQQLASRSS